MYITNDIKYIGVKDLDIDLFEGLYKVKSGMLYNSYVILDDKIAVMDKGKVLQIGTPMEVYKNPSNDFVANFVGTSNYIEQCEYKNFGIEKIDKPYIYKRPEEMILLDKTDKKGFVEVKIESKKFLGPLLEYIVVYNDKKYNVAMLNRENNESKLQVGDTAYLGLAQGE